MKHIRNVETVEALIKSASTQKPNVIKNLVRKWRKTASTHMADAAKLRGKNRDEEMTRLELIGQTYAEASERLAELIDDD